MEVREVECWGFWGLLLVATMASDKNLHLHVCFIVDLGSHQKDNETVPFGMFALVNFTNCFQENRVRDMNLSHLSHSNTHPAPCLSRRKLNQN